MQINMTKPKVSIIVPVYNVERYLRKCLDSLVAQTLEDIEILVVNDGSPDNSQEIIDDYAALYPQKIRAFIKENGGLSDARNYGIERAEGKYIAFVDSDDYVDLDFYEQMVNKAEETGDDVVCCPITYVYATKVLRKYYKESIFGFSVRESPELLYHANSFAWNKIYLREFWLKNGFRFQPQWFEDSQLIYNVLLAANRVDCVNIPFYFYLKAREDSITNTMDARVYDIFKSTDSIISYYKEHDAYDELYTQVEYLCVRHLIGRIQPLRKCRDKAEARRFLDKMFDYLNENFPNWKDCAFVHCNPKSKLKTKLKMLTFRTKFLMRVYVCGPQKLIRFTMKAIKLLKKVVNYRPKWLNKKKINEDNERKRGYIQGNGMQVLSEAQGVLRKIGIVGYADFGTCLGIIREGHLLKHDLDVDMGAIANKSEQIRARLALERHGFKLWREYLHDDYVVEESYHYLGVKIDINYYEITDEYARTWLFYRKPKHRYPSNTRHIVEMTYSPFNSTATVVIDDAPIAIPENAERLLAEKYGPNWRIPDTHWIYWESPAARKLEEIGRYITYRYSGRPTVPAHPREDAATVDDSHEPENMSAEVPETEQNKAE